MSIDLIRTLQQNAKFSEAIALCNKKLAKQNNHAILALLGTLYAQNHELEQARICLHRLNQITDSLAIEVMTDIAGIHLLLGEPQYALTILNEVIAKEPQFILAQVRRGLVLMKIGQNQAAIIDLQMGLKGLSDAHHSALHTNLARCYLQLGDPKTALQHITTAAQHGGDTKEAWILAAVDTYIALQNWTIAEATIQQALESGFNENICFRLLALVLAAQNKHDEAKYHLRKALKQQPNDVELLTQLALLAAIRGYYGEAIQSVRVALKIDPENSSLWTQLAHLSKRSFDEDLPQQAAERALQLTEGKTNMERADALVAMAAVKNDKGDWATAKQFYQQALNLITDYIPAQLGLGYLLLQLGKIDEAIGYFEQITKRNPIIGYSALINTRQFPDDPDILTYIEKAAYLPSLEGPVATGFLFNLAATYEHRKEYTKAFHFAQEANRATRIFLNYDSANYHQYCLALQHTFSRDFFAQRYNYGHASTLPVFILGMPRSGTTLIEQIIGGHQDIFVAGEIGILSSVIQKLNAWERHVGSGEQYPTCVMQLTAKQIYQFAELVLDELIPYAPNTRYIVDKMPHNFEHIGLIRLLFPQAAIIHVVRDPRDVAVSNYFTDYQAKFSGMGFAYDLSDIAQQLVDYQKLMTHWHAVVSKPILTVHYEKVIEKLAMEIRRILEYLQLDWIDSILNYQNLKRMVKTASVWQVRQPIYQGSTGKWLHYAEFLRPLEEILTTPAIDEHWKGRLTILPTGLFFKGMDYLHKQQGALAEAIFNDILNENPHHAAAKHMLGVALFQQGKLKASLQAMEESISRHGGHANWYKNVSVVLNALGLKKQAHLAYKKSQHLKNLYNEID